MFNSDLTKTFDHQDATMEILIMLAGAFILGCLLCWLIRKFLAENNHSLETNMATTQNLTGNNHTPPQTNASRKVKIVNKTSDTNYKTPRIDNLTKISGITPNIQNSLKDSGIKSYTDLRDIDREALKDILGTTRKNEQKMKEAETWPHQASLAAKGEWKKLSEYQAFIQRAKVASENVANTNPEKADDLKKIEGIGPKIEEALNKNKIYTFKDLRKSDSDTLKKYIVDEDSRFEKNDTESWPHQAGMAEKGQWEELGIYQEFMDIDNDSNTNPEVKSQAPELSLVSSQSQQDLKNKEEKNENNKLSSNSPKKDNLQKIEGIGPKIEEVLNNNNIDTYEKLHNTDRDTLKQHLEAAGSQFQMHEPESWPHQAGMAAREEWEELRTYQEFLDGGKETPSISASSKIDNPSLHIKNANYGGSNNDDLKKIEGIGPKIESLLKDAGIKTFEDLKNSNRNKLKSLLDAAGPQYRMHEPETWPLQAKMAFKGEWEKLKEYQDFLLGGRE